MVSRAGDEGPPVGPEQEEDRWPGEKIIWGVLGLKVGLVGRMTPGGGCPTRGGTWGGASTGQAGQIATNSDAGVDTLY